MRDIELRFVNRPHTKMINEQFGETYFVKMLQYRKKELDGWDNEYWTEWEDVPLEENP
jgi:hypothetical protein